MWQSLTIALLVILSCVRGSTALQYAALGDSYAAGDGAGSSRLLPNLDIFCIRTSDAYPVEISKSLELEARDFHNLACGGAFTTSVLKTQVPRATDSDIVTIQVGGNEVDFFLILNECVQQWHPFSTCEDELVRARGLIQSTAFMNRFDAMVAGAKATLKPGARLLILGYARFFNEQTTQCDRITFSRTDPSNLLTQSKRRELNKILVLLNEVIRGTAEGHGAIYVDTDKAFEGHRLCEEGVIEPDAGASWFFNDGDKDSFLTSRIRGDRDRSQLTFPNPFWRFVNFTRTFHPTSLGHIGIANAVLQTLDL